MATIMVIKLNSLKEPYMVDLGSTVHEVYKA